MRKKTTKSGVTGGKWGLAKDKHGLYYAWIGGMIPNGPYATRMEAQTVLDKAKAKHKRRK